MEHIVNNRRLMVYGLDDEKSAWLNAQLAPILATGINHSDALFLQPKGVGENFELVMEIHGHLNPTQLRMLADAIENTPS